MRNFSFSSPFAAALLAFTCLLFSACGSGEEGPAARAAVAANFTDTAMDIGAAFTEKTGHRIDFSFGSTGQLYAQIAQGAPFDLFLAADRERPARAIAEGLAVPGSDFTYALGRLALYSADPAAAPGLETLVEGDFDRIAIANPRTAPYGAAAMETMRALGIHDRLEAKIVRGNNVAQAYQFVETGNAQLGFVALGQLARQNTGWRWIVPPKLYSPIAQDAVLLTRGAGNIAARAFLDFLKGPETAAILRAHGYGLPE